MLAWPSRDWATSGMGCRPGEQRGWPACGGQLLGLNWSGPHGTGRPVLGRTTCTDWVGGCGGVCFKPVAHLRCGTMSLFPSSHYNDCGLVHLVRRARISASLSRLVSSLLVRPGMLCQAGYGWWTWPQFSFSCGFAAVALVVCVLLGCLP